MMENDLNISQHISKKFDQELEDLRNLVLKMGGLVEQQVSNGLEALLNGDEQLAKKVIKRDKKVNALEVEVDERCTNILARRQPAASDLRLIISIIKTITDLERMGDEAEKLAVSARAVLDSTIGERQYRDLKSLGNLVKANVKLTLDALARLDYDEALAAMRADDEVNAEFENLSRLLVLKMMEDPRTIKDALTISYSARALERIGDHAKNICEYIIFLIKGKDIRHIAFDDIEDTIDDQ
jgi:phosphate transport system protein